MTVTIMRLLRNITKMINLLKDSIWVLLMTIWIKMIIGRRAAISILCLQTSN